MSIKFRCPGCNRKLAADFEDAGAVTECPDCGTEIMVPAPEPEAPAEVAKPVETLMERVETLTRSLRAQKEKQKQEALANASNESEEQDDVSEQPEEPLQDKSSVTVQTVAPLSTNASTIKAPLSSPLPTIEKKTIQAPLLNNPTLNNGNGRSVNTHTSVLGNRLKLPEKKKASGFVPPAAKTPGPAIRPRANAPAIKAPAIKKREPEPQAAPAPNIQGKPANSAPFGVIQPVKPGPAAPPPHPSSPPQPSSAAPAPPAMPTPQSGGFGNCPKCNATIAMENAVICIECGTKLKEDSKPKSGGGLFSRMKNRG
jgi:DNA-directed RNA polymerase subunit RPC12/RpoP